MGAIKLLIVSMIWALLLVFHGCADRGFPNRIYEATYISIIDGKYVNKRNLVISAISKETFDSSNGKNVVEDISRNRTNLYYVLDYYYFDDLNNQVRINFYNLKPSPESSEKPGSTIAYLDDEGKIFRPMNNSTVYIIEEKDNYDSHYMLDDFRYADSVGNKANQILKPVI